MQSDYDSLSEIEAEILGYLEEHAYAADTVEGIRQWWLLKRLAEYSLYKVQQALDRLVAAERIQRRTLRDGRVVYAQSTPTRTPSPSR